MNETTGKDDFLQILGKNIRDARKAKGLSQEKLAKLCGFDSENSRSTISKIERGINDAPTSTLKAIAKALDTSVCDLTQRSEHAQKQMLIENLLENTYGSDAKILLDRFYSLNQSGRNELIKYLEYVSSQDQYKKESSNAKAIS